MKIFIEAGNDAELYRYTVETTDVSDPIDDAVRWLLFRVGGELYATEWFKKASWKDQPLPHRSLKEQPK